MVGVKSISQGSGDGSAAPDSDGRSESYAFDDHGRAVVDVQRFGSRDLDETRAFLSQFAHHTRVPHGGDAFAYEFVGASSSGLSAAQMKVAVRQTVRTTVRAPTIFLPSRTDYVFRIGRKAFQTSPSTAIFVAAGHEYTAHGPADTSLGLRIDGDLLCREISGRMRGRSRLLLLQSFEIPIHAGRLATFRAIHARMFAAENGTHPWGAYGDVGAFEAEVASWVAGIVIEQSGARAASAEGLHRIERLERWLDLHLGEDITLDQLCAVSGVRWRALQKLLAARYGQSPLEWIHARRLAAVHARLLKGHPDVAISRVALDCGFTHLGRFSAAYHRAYGELPSATLAAARAKRRKPGSLPS